MPDLESLCRALGERVTFVVTTEEAIRHADLKPLSAWVEHQPSWSDLPFIVLTQRGGGPERNPAAARVSEILRNVTFFERPFHATSFISIAKTARRARARQYEALGRMEELSEGERRLQTALRAGRLGSWEYDLATGVLVTSDVCKAVFGRNPDDSFTDTELLGTIHPDDRGTMQSLIDKAISSGEDFELECRTIWQDSSPHWAEFRGRAVRDRHGNVSRIVGVSSDITARKIAEKELIELNGTLEDRVVERTLELHDAHQSLLAQVKQREIAEEQLRQAQKMEAIGHLTGGVAHDFNNLLMAVLGNLDLLRKHCMNDPKATRLIDGALKGAQRGAALTQRLLAFARRQDLKVEPVDLIELVRGMNDLLRRSVGSNIQLNYDLPAALPPVLADANQIELALLNLVVNSRDAISKSGEIGIGLQKMEVAASTQDLTAGTYVVMSVRDNGQGMTPETLERAIDPFFSTKELGKGTGLGLSMIHGLAVQLKGALRLSSSTGAGTKAELWLPVSTGSKSSANPGVEVSPEIVEAKFRILMVDDDALIAMSTVDMLEDLGHEVIEAHSGKDALEILEAGEEVDLLITDYSMPKMTGAELAKAARLLKPGLPVLIATGYADLPPGMDIDIPRLAKPYTQADLASHIAKALAN